MWLHIGFHNFGGGKPYGPAYMEVVQVPDPGEAPPSDRRLYVRTTHQYFTQHQALEVIARDAEIQGRIYLVEESDRQLVEALPHTVPVVVCPSSNDWERVWPPVRGKKRQQSGLERRALNALATTEKERLMSFQVRRKAKATAPDTMWMECLLLKRQHCFYSTTTTWSRRP